MHFVLFLIVTTLGLWTRRGYAQDVRVFLTPLEFNAGEGLSATFSCSVSNAAGLLWRVDNIILPDNRLTARGITGPNTTSTNENRNFQSQITIPAAPENDNSSVRCDGIGGGVLVQSSIATFRVQGMMSYGYCCLC